MIVLLLLSLIDVSVGSGWSDPLVVTEEPNSTQPLQFITRDSYGRFHMVWSDFNQEPRIGYKIFLMDGTTVVPEAMISRDVNSAYLSDVSLGDSLFAFWRESNPVYYSIRSLEDGSEVTPVTYLFTEYTNYQEIKFSPDSLGRLHVVRNIGSNVYYAVWTPAPGSGFVTEFETIIPEAWIIGMILVDGDRVHLILGNCYDQSYGYMQYDLEGNITVPFWDFTNDNWNMMRFPKLAVDSTGDLIIVSRVGISGYQPRFGFWRIDGESGELEQHKWMLVSDPPNIYVTLYIELLPLPGNDSFYLVWLDSPDNNIVWYSVIDRNGSFIVEPTVGYDYGDEDPEDLRNIDGVVDSEGNLYLIYSQGEEEPIFGRYPTFGWFIEDSLGIYEEGSPELEGALISIEPSCNPFCVSVEFHVTGGAVSELSVYDLTGHLVSEIPITDGVGIWDGSGFSGDRLPIGVYTISGGENCEPALVTLLKE